MSVFLSRPSMYGYGGSYASPSEDTKERLRQRLLRTLGYNRTIEELLEGSKPEVKMEEEEEESEEQTRFDLYYDGEFIAPMEKTPFDDLFADQTDFRFLPYDEFDLTHDLGWFPFMHYEKPWAENLHPIKRIFKYSDLKLQNKELLGGLSGLIMATGLTNLDRVPNTVSYALTKLQLPNKNIADVSLLAKYKYLQYIDLSHNVIQDLTPLQHVPYLMLIDASFNMLSTFNIKPAPWFLTYVNLSFNRFTEIPDFTPYWSVKHLNLSNNQITEINEGLRNMKYLKYLNLSNNLITTVQNLFGIPLVELDLSHNQIIGETQDVTHTENYLPFKTVITLEELNMDSNRLESLSFISTARLKKLIASNNYLSMIQVLNDIEKMTELKELVIHGNEIMNVPDIYRHLIYLCPKIEKINKEKIGIPERVNARCMYGNNLFNEAIKNHTYSLLYNHIEPPPLGEDLVQINCNSAVLALVGPPGSGIETIINNLVEKHGEYVKVLKLHRTPVVVVKTKPRPSNQTAMFVRDDKLASKSIFNPRLPLLPFDCMKRRSKSRFDFSISELPRKCDNLLNIRDINMSQSSKEEIEFEDETDIEEEIDFNDTNYPSLYHHATTTQFNKLWKEGKFIFVFHSLGCSFGLCFDELTDDGKICLLGVNLQQAYELKWHGLEPTCLLTMPTSVDIHEKRLKDLHKAFVSINNDSELTKRHTRFSSRQPTLKEPSMDYSRMMDRESISTDPTASLDESLNSIRSYRKATAFYGAFCIKNIWWYDDSSERVSDQNIQVDSKKIKSVTKRNITTEKSVEDLIQKIMSTRQQYMTAHDNCLFMMAISTDDLDIAEQKVTKIAHQIYQNKKDRNSLLLESIQPRPGNELYKPLVKPMLDEMIDVLKDSSKLEWMDAGDKFIPPPYLFPDVMLKKSMTSLTLGSSRESIIYEDILHTADTPSYDDADDTYATEMSKGNNQFP
ncbi:uncharacterized protein LOC106668096 [Cimex lectularius]|uniref:Uncharacterized protein n=1 Tax=Cimex lectularius TaxID=79782 RepID=A0A8I6TFE9_CIMLE|nr:uncharacterized protein LOC106668096 [Cimex lectularius]